MGKNRLEAFSDGVLAIIITIMVLEMKVPHGDNWDALRPLLPVFLTYLLSFVYIGIYWNNHHHLLHTATRITGGVLWSNNHLLFWLSLMPFTSGWMSENHYAPIPTALFGVDLLMAGVAYYLLEQCLINLHGHDSVLAKAVGRDTKGQWSVIIYAIAIAVAFREPRISLALYTVVALLWLVPDRRIEKRMKDSEH